jgi:hypothetical protein
LERAEQFPVLAHGVGRHVSVGAERGERAGRLADVPFHGVEAVRAVGDVGRAEVLVAGQQVRHPPRQERAERDLERTAADVEVALALRGRVQVDPVQPDAHGIEERLRVGVGAAQVRCDVLLDHPEHRQDAARLADVRVFGEPVRGADHVGRKRRPGQPVPPSGRGASVCIQYRSDSDRRFASSTSRAASSSGLSIRLPPQKSFCGQLTSVTSDGNVPAAWRARSSTRRYSQSGYAAPASSGNRP